MSLCQGAPTVRAVQLFICILEASGIAARKVVCIDISQTLQRVLSEGNDSDSSLDSIFQSSDDDDHTGGHSDDLFDPQGGQDSNHATSSDSSSSSSSDDSSPVANCQS